MDRSTTPLRILLALAVSFGLATPTQAQECGPGRHWVHRCPAGDDFAPMSVAVVGIDTNDDCIEDASFILNGPTTIHRDAGVPHTILTEIVSLSLTGGVILTAGQGLGLGPNGDLLDPSLGAIVEQKKDRKLADSFFDVFFEVFAAGIFLYNHDSIQLTAVVDRVPPLDTYIHPISCTPLYFDPPVLDPLDLTRSGINLIRAEHTLEPPPLCTDLWQVTDIFTIGTGQTATNNPKVSHIIIGNIVDPDSLESTADRIPVCAGTFVTVVVTDVTGTPTITAGGSLLCDSAGCTGVVNVTEKYKAVSFDGKDTDRMTLFPQ